MYCLELQLCGVAMNLTKCYAILLADARRISFVAVKILNRKDVQLLEGIRDFGICDRKHTAEQSWCSLCSPKLLRDTF